MHISRFIVVNKDTYIHWQRMTKNDVIVRRNRVTDHGSQSPDCVTALVEGECSIIIELLVIILLCVYVCMYVFMYVCLYICMFRQTLTVKLLNIIGICLTVGIKIG